MATYEETPQLAELVEAARKSPGHRVKLTKGGTVMELVVFDDRVNVYVGDDSEPSGTIRFGSPRSGGIWRGGEFIAQYDVATDGTVTIVTVERGYKRPASEQQADPVAYLVASV